MSNKTALSDDLALAQNGCHFKLRRRKPSKTWEERQQLFISGFGDNQIEAVRILLDSDESDPDWDYCLSLPAMELARREHTRKMRPSQLSEFLAKYYPYDPFEILEDARLAIEREKLKVIQTIKARLKNHRHRTGNLPGRASPQQVAAAEAKKITLGVQIRRIEQEIAQRTELSEKQIGLHAETLRRLELEHLRERLPRNGTSHGPQS